MNLDNSTVEAAQQRGGGREVGRNAEIDEILESDCLGWQNKEPLVGDDYSDYPDYTEISQPRWLSFLKSLFSHSLITDYHDARKELTAVTADSMVSEWEESLEKAANLFGIDAQALFEKGETVSTDSKLKQLLGYEPAEEVKQCSNPLLVSELYLEGLSVEEIGELLEGDRENARDSLKTVGLLEGKTSDEQTSSFERRNGRLSTHGNDNGKNLTVNTKNL
jgi:hypothetical protein